MANNLSTDELLEAIVNDPAAPKPQVTEAQLSRVSDVGGSSTNQTVATQQQALQAVQLPRKRRHPLSQRVNTRASRQGAPSAAGLEGLLDDDGIAADPAAVYCPEGIRDAEHVPQGEASGIMHA
jgi:hypothetical protein